MTLTSRELWLLAALAVAVLVAVFLGGVLLGSFFALRRGRAAEITPSTSRDESQFSEPLVSTSISRLGHTPLYLRDRAVVIVEDEPDILIIMHRLLRDLVPNYDIVTAIGGSEALAAIALRSVPLVFTDYNMPDMDGLQLTKAIKETSPDTCVVMITGYATPELEQRAYAHRVDHFLPKPFAIDDLKKLIRKVLPDVSPPE